MQNPAAMWCFPGAESFTCVCAGEPIPLEEFEEVYLRPYLLSDEQFQSECKIAFDHTAPAPDAALAIGGSPSAVQGL